MIFLVAAWFVHMGWLSDREIKTVTEVMDKSKFLDSVHRSADHWLNSGGQP